MKTSLNQRGLSLFTTCLIFALLVNHAPAGHPISGEFISKKPDKEATWSFSLYGAMIFGQQFENPNGSSGNLQPSRSTMIQDKYDLLSKLRPTAWMIALDYRLSKTLGTAFLFSYSDLGQIDLHPEYISGQGNIFNEHTRMSILSVMLLVHLNDYIILGAGPSYNMVSIPSGYNQPGFMAQMNVRIPISKTFAVSGIAQYRYAGSAEIGPIYTQNSVDVDGTEIVSTTQIHPATEIGLNHFFLGLGVTISSGQ